MGKKKKHNAIKEEKEAWCYYCDRVFEHEEVLIQHQKAKHFKCPTCSKKLSTAGGLVVHNSQVHKITVTKVPNAKEGRDSVDYEIYGINGIPEEAIAERAAKKARVTVPGADANPAAKKQEVNPEVLPPGQPPGVPGQPMLPQFHPQMPGMMYGQPKPGMPFHQVGQPGFPGMMGGPRPGFNPMPNGMPQMPPHMFGGPPGPNGQFQGMYGIPGGPMPGYPRGPGAPPGAPPGPPRNLPPGHDPPPAPPSKVEQPPNGATPVGPPGGAPIPPVPPLFPAGAAPPIAGGPSINRDPTTGSRASEPPAPSRGPGGSAKEPHATAGDEEFSMEEKRAELAAYKV